MSDAVLAIDDLWLGFGRKQQVLRGCSLQLEPGKVTVLLGQNGAGKSSLLRVLLGALRPDRGRVRLWGMDPLRHHRAVLQRIGYVPDVPDVYPWMTVQELGGFLQPHYPTWNSQRFAELGERLSVPQRTRFAAMSRGQGMKAMLVAALASEPELLLLDEPFAGLDPIVREEVLQGVLAGLGEDGRTVLCATHELELAARIADRIAVLRDGAITRHGTLAEVLGDDEPAALPRALHKMLAAEFAATGAPREVAR